MTEGVRGPRVVELPAALDTLDDARKAVDRLSFYTPLEMERLLQAVAERCRPEMAWGRLRAAQPDSGMRPLAYEVVERDLRKRRVDRINVRPPIFCAIRECGDGSWVRAPMPTLLGAVDLLGDPPAEGGA